MKRTQRLLPILIAVATMCLVGVVSAHPHHELEEAHAPSGGLGAGLLHPFLGLDHLLAMLAVGMIAAQYPTRSMWFVPGSFVAAMIVGGLGGAWGAQAGMIEIGIDMSLVMLGTAIAIGRKLPFAAVLLAVAAFGFVHGYAHGLEMPKLASPLLYALGFNFATVVLHVAGVGIGLLARQQAVAARSLQVSGAAIAVFGVCLLFRQ